MFHCAVQVVAWWFLLFGLASASVWPAAVDPAHARGRRAVADRRAPGVLAPRATGGRATPASGWLAAQHADGATGASGPTRPTAGAVRSPLAGCGGGMTAAGRGWWARASRSRLVAAWQAVIGDAVVALCDQRTVTSAPYRCQAGTGSDGT